MLHHRSFNLIFFTSCDIEQIKYLKLAKIGHDHGVAYDHYYSVFHCKTAISEVTIGRFNTVSNTIVDGRCCVLATLKL